ncbi:hypothetical protein SAMN04487957_105191 [Halomonas shengliensis]|uniref:DUF2333 domain-containing protein n=1 Tax=Halomonas shengliensis TaxID=419597 RepID=A0A1H0IMV0_9GAMM|nr:DUF2333 family protein [Halomonas shengliensis]SDO32732.1 hypothetical protein SAMN04487957_105191 [Halomonas shengliensis]
MAWTRKGDARRRKRVEALERPDYGWIWKPLLGLLLLYVVVTLALGAWWSRTPAVHSVERLPMERRGDAGAEPAARGAVTVATLASIVETLYAKPGGYLRNDRLPPGLWLDNMPSWERGVLRQAQDLARALPSMHPGEAGELETAIRGLAGDGLDWYRPATETHLGEAVAALDRQLSMMSGMQTEGFTPGAGLPRWLADVGARLDDLGLRLASGAGSHQLLRELAIDTEALPAGTPWYRVDNVFFEARGTGWALVQMLEGVQRDQADALAKAGVVERWERLRAELAMTQRRLWSPLVMSGSGFGPFANHALVMALHVSRSRELVEEIREALVASAALPATAAEPGAAPASEPEVIEVTPAGEAHAQDGASTAAEGATGGEEVAAKDATAAGAGTDASTEGTGDAEASPSDEQEQAAEE